VNYGNVKNFDAPVQEDVVMAEESVPNTPGAANSAVEEDDWSLEYDLDDQQEQEALEDPANQMEEEGESELDNFTDSMKSGSEEDLDAQEGELSRMDQSGSDMRKARGHRMEYLLSATLMQS